MCSSPPTPASLRVADPLRAPLSTLLTVACVHVTFATAEPWGAYHLGSLVPSLPSGIRPTHLIPHDAPLQGRAFPASTDPAVLERTDALVCTGGGLSPWTAPLVHHANLLGVPVVLLELAYCSPLPRLTPPPPLEAVLVSSERSARAHAAHLRIPLSQITVVGHPALDDVPDWTPLPRRVLAATTVSETSLDAGVTLRAGIRLLASSGFDVVVRPHPREPRHRWAEFELDHSASAREAAASSELVVTYPGSAILPFLAVGVPVIALATEEWMTSRLPAFYLEAVTCATSLVSLPTLAHEPWQPPPELRAALLGPRGAAPRIWDAITAIAHRGAGAPLPPIAL